ncbi:ATP-binding cassette domain-containing protein [Niabella sp. W65]|nr:ATP-binding cassette domain-containing protein [Niabella sp. W65]MCH7362316.1 ATP-binding cassette domain-containing protein [Niabella sp. W65]ULT38290.1 ATP-binding cassette domain-containing protein [Niabella sp. I65]
MKNIRVRYDDKEVLSGIDWQVNAGERWLLQGHNGSGKSTLLSLVTGDHPQAYANDIKLFGVQRGGGESIWDIKRRIGLISPELHWYFDANATVLKSLASGFLTVMAFTGNYAMRKSSNWKSYCSSSNYRTLKTSY